ncbi:hypothetical protein N8827_02645 [Pelagibacteraceae bacterium]|nr:hypothetical protein [Pelagibacteraceae bacterium]
MKLILTSISIFLALAMSRFIPHPPNFTSLIALSFYVPVLLGLRFLPALIISFAITDLIIGYHSGTHWTWGSVLVIGLMSQYFGKNINLRLIGSLFGASIFFLITNFGVWISGYYGLNLNGLIQSYFFALPFFGYTILSTLIFSVIIEAIYKIYSGNFEKYFKFNKR